MIKLKKLIIASSLMISVSAMGQNTFEGRYSRSLHDVLEEISVRFDVRFKTADVDTTGLVLPFADSRIRPYSFEETMRNVLSPFDFVHWKNGNKTWKIKPYEYPRRKEPDGEKLLAYLNTLYSNLEQWKIRRDSLKVDVRRRLGIDSYLERCVEADPRYGKTRKYDGYTVTNFRLQIMEGRSICGSIYKPAKSGKKDKLPVIICPAGHFAGGRYNPDLQKRYATLARMGAIAVSYDIYGWGQSEEEVGKEVHETPEAHIMQTIHGIKILDFMLKRDDVDSGRVGCNGGSGGGSQVVLLCTLDDRYTAACPTVSMSAWFDGGCPCESGMPIHLACGGSCNPELAATFAPKPMMVISDGGDWTHTTPESEFPYLQRIYGFYGAKDNVQNIHLPDERHDFGPNKRAAVYKFFTEVFGLDSTMIDEDKVTIETEKQLRADGGD